MADRWTRDRLAELDAQLYELLAAENPLTARHCFYRMTNPRLVAPVPKTELGYRRVQDRLVKMRRSGSIPYEWIADGTRAGMHVATWDSPESIMTAAAEQFRGRVWPASGPEVTVWCESRSLASVLVDVCTETAVSLYPCGGFSSLTLPYEAACRANRGGYARYVAIYIGDYDPAGTLIDQALESELALHLNLPMQFERMGINEDQIARYDLPTKPRKRTERRRPDIRETVEAEAMNPATLRALLHARIMALLPGGRGALDAAAARDRATRTAMLTAIANMP